jgi:hypothetical protein
MEEVLFIVDFRLEVGHGKLGDLEVDLDLNLVVGLYNLVVALILELLILMVVPILVVVLLVHLTLVVLLSLVDLLVSEPSISSLALQL